MSKKTSSTPPSSNKKIQTAQDATITNETAEIASKENKRDEIFDYMYNDNTGRRVKVIENSIKNAGKEELEVPVVVDPVKEMQRKIIEEQVIDMLHTVYDNDADIESATHKNISRHYKYTVEQRKPGIYIDAGFPVKSFHKYAFKASNKEPSLDLLNNLGTENPSLMNDSSNNGFQAYLRFIQRKRLRGGSPAQNRPSVKKIAFHPINMTATNAIRLLPFDSNIIPSYLFD